MRRLQHEKVPSTQATVENACLHRRVCVGMQGWMEVRSRSLGQSLLSNLWCLIGPCCLSRASWPESFPHDSCLHSGLSAGALRLQMPTAAFLFPWVLGTCSPIPTYVQLSPAPYCFPNIFNALLAVSSHVRPTDNSSTVFTPWIGAQLHSFTWLQGDAVQGVEQEPCCR